VRMRVERGARQVDLLVPVTQAVPRRAVNY